MVCSSGPSVVYTGCGRSGVGEYHVIVANPADQSFTAVLRIKLTGPEQLPILDGIRATFDSASGDQAVAPSAPSTTVASAAPTDAFAPSGAIPDGWTALVDDTQTLSLSVPAAWTGIHRRAVAARQRLHAADHRGVGRPGPCSSAETSASPA